MSKSRKTLEEKRDYYFKLAADNDYIVKTAPSIRWHSHLIADAAIEALEFTIKSIKNKEAIKMNLQEDKPKDADPILDEEELLLETIKDLDFQIIQATKKLQDHQKDKAHYLNRLKVYRQGKTGKDPEQEQAERALIKRFADYLTIEKVTATTLARFIFVNKAKDSIEEVITMVVPNVINEEDGSLHEGICDLIKTYPEAEISISVWNCEA